VAQFLDTFDVERTSLLRGLDRFEQVWSRFQQHRGLEMDGTEQSDSLISGEVELVRRELEQARLNVGLFGLIKRGKSTLLNSLLGLEVSSMHVTPETAVPVYVDYGDTPRADVYFADGRVVSVAPEEVHFHTSQKHNANNVKGVMHVHQHVPVGFLRNGVRLVDTPGLDDAQTDEIYTERTLQELDAVDAGVIVFLSPPTVGATELDFLQEVSARQLKKVFLVCNMYPQHFHDPETRRAVLSYVGGRIVEASRKAGLSGRVRIYAVCALEAWQARKEMDIERYRASGAALLHRDLEQFLSESAGRRMINEAARRISYASNLAKGEVRVRRALLDDPELLASHRARLDDDVRRLEREFDVAINATIAAVEPLRIRVRSMLTKPFPRAKRTIEACKTVEELEEFASKFRREIEVSAEVAARTFQAGFESILERLRVTLEDKFNEVVLEIASNAPKIVLNQRAFLLTPDQLRAVRRDSDVDLTRALSGAAAGSVLSGGVAIALVGGVLGPVGLLAGALVGWKFGELFGSSRGVAKGKELLIERLDEIALELTRDFDKQVRTKSHSVADVVRRRRRSFASDLYREFEFVEALAKDHERVESYRRDCDRFAEAFDDCAASVLRSVGLTAESLAAEEAKKAAVG
jgi:ribosomal protein L31E